MRSAIVVIGLLMVVASLSFAQDADPGEVELGDAGEIVPQAESPPAQVQTVIRELRTKYVQARNRRDWRACDRISREKAALTLQLQSQAKRLKYVESNPLGGQTGQHAMWDELRKGNIASHGDIRQIVEKEYGLKPIAASTTSPAVPPATPQTTVAAPPPGGKNMTIWYLAIVAGTVLGIVAMSIYKPRTASLAMAALQYAAIAKGKFGTASSRLEDGGQTSQVIQAP